MALKPINDVPEEHRTEARDDAANEIMEYLEAGHAFNAELLADVGAWSPQHYRNVRDYYFEVVDHPDAGAKELVPEQQTARSTTQAQVREPVVSDGGRVIEVPDDVESVASYLQGYIDGLQAA